MTFTEFIGASTWGVVLAGAIGFLSRKLIEQQLSKDLERYKSELIRAIEREKSALAVFASSLDYLHQERGKATIELIKLLKIAMGGLKQLVSPNTAGIDHPTFGARCID